MQVLTASGSSVGEGWPQWITPRWCSAVGRSRLIPVLPQGCRPIDSAVRAGENHDVDQTFDISFKNRGLVTGLRGTICLRKYLLGKFEKDGRFRLQANVSIVGPTTRVRPNRGPEPGPYEVRDTTLASACRARPKLEVQPAQALQSSTWDAGTKELRITLGHELGAVEISLTGP